MNWLTVIILILVVSVPFIYLVITKRNNRYKTEAYHFNLQQIQLFFDTINNHEDYVTWPVRDHIKETFRSTGKYFKGKSNYYKKEERVKTFNDIFQTFDSYIVEFNKNYVKTQKENLSIYFNDIEGKSLDEQQRTALITDEYSNLIIAGAGSGKTLTILGKVKYLIEKKNIDPDDILLLSFTKKTVNELNERLQNMSLKTKATTFHKLGYDTIKTLIDTVPVITNENTLTNVIKKYLRQDIFNDRKALEAYVSYIACYMNILKENDEYDSLGEKIDTEKGIDLHTLKSKCENTSLNKVGVSDLNTFQGEKVKSVEELTISNFLYLNGIEYEYEKAYPFGDIPYQPDFYLKEYDIYLEHFGIDENENAKWLDEIEEKKYVHGIKLKREKHEKFGTKLLETYSYYNRNNVLLEKLTEMLNNENVVFKPREMDVIFEKVTNNNPNYGKEIINLIKTFVNLYKSRKMDVKSVKSLFLNKKNFDSFYIKRHDCFLKFVIPILNKYDQALQERNEIDFHDMINLATDLIKEKLPDYSYKYIIIDEYQDVSFSRFNLIKEIRDLSKSRLICVGDDWQSIYRFAGSDISLFSNFEKFIGKHEQLFIEQTYRNSQPLIEVTSKFIQKNPKQIVKSPKSKKEPLKNPIQFVNYYQGNAEAALVNQIELLVKKYGKKSIIVLGRHNFDINEFITRSPESRIMYYERTGKLHVKGFEDVDISYLSIHKSKGLEADNVIVLNLRNHLLGFPNKIADDPILSLLLSDSESYPFSEERRLFYVALTRTKNEVILLIPKDASIFVDELLKDRIKSNNIDMDNEVKCPCCKTGNLVLRTKYFNKKFLGCSNYPLCKQTFQNIEIIKRSKKCSKCKSGFMVMRQGKYGNFLGCTNYPHCNNVIKLK